MNLTAQSKRSLAPVGMLTGLVCGVLILGPALAPGYVWLYDMIFVSHLPLSAHTLGIDGSVPRAVPTDAVVALLSTVVPGSVVQKALLLAAFVGVGGGCAKLCKTAAGAITAALAACWNPYVAERLVIGHWSFLLGYATLPWIFLSAKRWGAGERSHSLALFGWLTLASMSGSTSAVIASVAAVVSLCLSFGERPEILVRAKRILVVGVVMLALNASWIVPSLTRPGGVPADSSGVEAFEAGADSPLGVWPSLLTLGGIWHQPSWPGSRTSVVTVGLALLVLLALLILAWRMRSNRHLMPFAVAGACGLAIAGLSSVPGGTHFAVWIVQVVPGGGIIRDSQKFIALFAVFVAVLAGSVVDALVTRRDTLIAASRKAALPIVAAVVIGVAPLATLPDAVWGVGGKLHATSIPSGFTKATEYFDEAPPGGVAVFPWTLYRRFTWNGGKVSLDPWNRLLDRRVLVNDDLPLSTKTVKGEDPYAQNVTDELALGGGNLSEVLRTNGARWVILLDDQPGASKARTLLASNGLREAKSFGEIRIFDVGPGTVAQTVNTSKVPIFIFLITGCVALIAWGFGAVKARRPRMTRS